ncbi:MAG: hypothetical protein IT168_24665, partial [Bryobacterales bacterium]|nr:hypothetical protein [Bryobacterales bacterium]
KKISSQNALKHGLASDAIPEALEPAFNHLRNELAAQCRPEGPLEEIFFDKLVAARWNMLRALDLQNELYLLTEGQDPMGHPATQKEAELYSRYYIRYEGSFNRAYKQLKDSQTNRACQFIQAHPEIPCPTLPLADLLKIQRFAKRTPAPATDPCTAPITEPRPSGSVAESDDILNHFSPFDQAELRDEAELLGVSINHVVASAAKYARHALYEQIAKSETNPIPADMRR